MKNNIKRIFGILVILGFWSCKPKQKLAVEIKKEVVNKKTQSLKKEILFTTKDGLSVTGDVYLCPDKKAPFIILFHQANYSRGEYLEIAPKLNALGYHCLAIDQRSGKEINGVINETHKIATYLKKPTTYIDALPDLQASVDFVKRTYQPSKLIVWGSSYSSSLVFILGNTHKKDIDAIVSFSPGEYFSFEGKKIEDFAKNITVPVFITSTKKEASSWSTIFENIQSEKKMNFIPATAGIHGSKALWEKQKESSVYWKSVKFFLNSI